MNKPMERDPNLEAFYAGEAFPVSMVEAVAGNIAIDNQLIVTSSNIPTISDSAVNQRLNAISHQTYEQDGYAIGVSVINPEATTDRTRVFGATFRAAMDNDNGPGNAVEQAVRYEMYDADQHQAAAETDRTVYLGFPYNGSNSPLTAKEIKHFKTTGRATYEDDGRTHALPYFRAVAKILTKSGYEVTELMGDSAGGICISALGVALASPKIEHYYANGRPQMTSLSPQEIFLAQMYENKKGKELYESSQLDALRLPSEEWKQYVKRLAPDVFKDDAPMLKGHDLVKVANGLRRGPQDGDPLIADLSAMIRLNPQTAVTLVHGSGDRFTGLHYDTNRAIQVAQKLSQLSDKGVKMVALPGQSHSWHTYLPMLYHSVYMQTK